MSGGDGRRENEPILSSAFERASPPPAFGALHNLNGVGLGIERRPWQEALGAFVVYEWSISNVEHYINVQTRRTL